MKWPEKILINHPEPCYDQAHNDGWNECLDACKAACESAKQEGLRPLDEKEVGDLLYEYLKHLGCARSGCDGPAISICERFGQPKVEVDWEVLETILDGFGLSVSECSALLSNLKQCQSKWLKGAGE